MKYSIEDTTLTSIANAIREKTETTGGIDVADMAEIIKAIGGGKITHGSFTLGSDTKVGEYVVTHDLGEIPTIFILWKNSSSSGSSNEVYRQSMIPSTTLGKYIFDLSIYSTSTRLTFLGNQKFATDSFFTENTMINFPKYTNNDKYVAGNTYYWVAIGNEV